MSKEKRGDYFDEVKSGGLIRRTVSEFSRLTPRAVADARRLAKDLRGKTVIHVNATPVGGGVAEMLASQVSMERSLGIKSRWLVIRCSRPAFFDVTKKIHNLMQGKPGVLTAKEKALYRDVNRNLGASLREFLEKNRLRDGVIVIHDPQPMAVIEAVPEGFRTVLRLHIDLSTPNRSVTEFFRPLIRQFRRVVVSNRGYARALGKLPPSRLAVVMPAIDPFCAKNHAVPRKKSEAVMRRFGIDPKRPIMTQISRFDPWKRPLGVLEAYRRLKPEFPDLQLVLTGFIAAKDDPEQGSIVAQVKAAMDRDPDVHLFYDFRQIAPLTNDAFVNALQATSTVVVQNSVREGFGLTMTEPMWKGKPLVAGDTVGARMQIRDKISGFIIRSETALVRSLRCLLADRKLRERVGRAARESVRRKFLMTRYLVENLRTYR